MIKLVALCPALHPALELVFSDGSRGTWLAEPLIARATILTRPLANPSYFARAFIEGGALAWPNGLELSPAALHAQLARSGALIRAAA